MNTLQQWLTQLKNARPVKLPKPEPGYKWVRVHDEYRQLCEVCHGNCGQCGSSRNRDLPADFSAIVDNINAGK